MRWHSIFIKMVNSKKFANHKSWQVYGKLNFLCKEGGVQNVTSR